MRHSADPWICDSGSTRPGTMWSCDEVAIGIRGARHKTPWNANSIIGQGICRSCDVLFNRSVQSVFLWDVSPKRFPIDGDSLYELWANRMHKTYFVFSCIDLDCCAYISVRKSYICKSKQRFVGCFAYGVREETIFVHGAICGKSDMENGPKTNLEGRFS